MDFLTDFTIKGKWWTPHECDVENEELYGELSFKKLDGIKLVLEGSLLKTKRIFEAKHNFKIDIIHGLSKDGLHIAVFNSTAYEVGSNSWIFTEINADFLLINDAQCLALPSTEIKALNFSTNFFHSYFGHTNNIIKPSFGTSRFEFEHDKNEAIEIMDNEILSAYFYFSRSFHGLGQEEFVFKQKPYFNVKYKDFISIEKAIEQINYFRNFFSFLSSPVISFEAANLFTQDQHDRQVDFRLFFKQQAKQVGERIKSHEVLLSYEEMQNDIKELLSKWIESEEQNKSMLALYMQLVYMNFPSQIQQFINVVFALETLHNTFFDYKIFSNEEIKKFKMEKKQALKDVFSEKFKAKIEECLGHFSNPSFSQRLKDLISKDVAFFKDYIKDIDDFAKRVTKQRNYLAHDHHQIERATIQESEYGYFIAILKLIFEYSFLKVTGYNDKQIKSIIKRNLQYNFYKNKSQMGEGFGSK